MDVFRVVKEYVDRMIPSDTSMKVLLLDRETVPILSTAYTQTLLLERGVFLVDQVFNRQRKVMKAMRCIIFVRPTKASLNAVAEEIRAARYSSYTLGFSNALPTDSLNALAGADEEELVTRVEEYFADFVALNSDLMIMPSPHGGPTPLIAEAADVPYFNRLVAGLTASCLAFRRKPLIRFQSNSPLTKTVSSMLATAMKADVELFDYKAKDTVILIVDRADDPLTPLLTQWTYQAMLHDLVGLDNNRLVLPDQKAEDGYVFSAQDDKFFADNMYSNWGELCVNVKQHVETYKVSTNIDKATATIDDLKQLMQNLPQAKQLSSSVTKHTTVVSHLSKVIKERRLLDLSLLEQAMASENNANDHWTRIVAFDNDPTVNKADIARLCLIYNLRYEKVAKGSKAEGLLMRTPYCTHVQNLRAYFGTRDVTATFNSGVMKSVVSYIKGFKDEQNIFTQHEPLLKRNLQALALGKLDMERFPYLAPPTNAQFRPKEVIVCMVGGTTYEEAAMVHKINSDPAICGGLKVLLSAPLVHSTSTFLEALDPESAR
jgi:vacuolar protein sorting-associated protein 45